MANRQANPRRVEEKVTDYSIISLMATDKPIAVYRKAKGIIGLVNVRVFNSLTNEIEDILLEGDPSNPECQECLVEIWSEKEHVFFKRSNKKHLEAGLIVPWNHERPDKVKKTANNLTDDELEVLVKKPFLALKAAAEKMTTEVALTRLIKVAEDAEKPEKTMQYLRERLSRIQSGEPLG